MAKLFKFLILALVAGFSGAAVTVLLHVGIAPESVTADDVTYSDFLSITLTALALMITVLGFFVAAAGVIGWTTLENKLRSHSIEYFQEQLKKDASLRKELEEIIVRIGYQGIESFKSQKGITGNKTRRENKTNLRESGFQTEP